MTLRFMILENGRMVIYWVGGNWRESRCEELVYHCVLAMTKFDMLFSSELLNTSRVQSSGWVVSV